MAGTEAQLSDGSSDGERQVPAAAVVRVPNRPAAVSQADPAVDGRAEAPWSRVVTSASRYRPGTTGRSLSHVQPASSWRAAAAAVSSGRVLKAIAAVGAALWITFTTVSNIGRLLGGSLRPPPITTQS
jgi:hypothetical protein